MQNRIARYYDPEPLTARNLDWYRDVEDAYWAGYCDGNSHVLSLCTRALVVGVVIGWIVGAWWA